FVSIRCCADSNVIDPITNISWITDSEWYPDRSNCQDVTSRAAENNTVGYGRVRIFSSQIENNKWCYNLTTVKNQDYLIRGTFISGGTPSKSFFSFNVMIGTTLIGTVNSSFDTEVEGVFKATGDYINFCLEKDAKVEEGDPYISKLELRPLGNSDYLMQEEPSSVLKLIERVDVGSNELKIRYPMSLYPYDRYDRIWRKELHTNQEANRTSSSAANINNTETTAPPIQVLQTALTHPVRLVFLHNDLVPGNNNYNLHLYFLELDDSVQMGQRVFDIFINDEKRQENIDILAGNSNYKAALLNFNADGFLNLTLVKASNGSQLGPVISAYEILQVYPSVQGTAQKDVDVITEVRNELMGDNQNNEVLKTWSGDPCYPISWHGLYCEAVNNSLVITILDLSHNDLTGNIPGSLISLPYLKTLIDDLFVKSISIENFTLESIEAATQNYKTLIGEGGFGAVYRGLTYLHTFAGRCVIHRDVKSSNILLDQSMCAKVADFGFSKYAPQEGDSGGSLEVRGTAGYLDPEYYSTHHLSAKSDVFSFGIVLLEMITGREPLNIHRPRNEFSLVEWAKPFIRNSRIDEIVDPSIKGGYHAEAMWRVVEVALACIENFSANRPCMVDIVRELEDALIIENNSSEYMNSISFGVSNRFSIERTIIHPPPTTPAEESHVPSQPAPPQPR
ncbi:hypothetical protein C3L33_18582, partial [Rhododendron williamsianum]